ncbi:unnamed protein product [Brassica oleracea]
MVPFITSNPKSFNALIFHHKGGNTKPSRKLSIIKEKKSALVLRLIIYGLNKRMESNTHENHPIPQPKQGRDNNTKLMSPLSSPLSLTAEPPPSSTPPLATTFIDTATATGHVVLILSPNSIYFPVVSLAVMSLGAVVITANTLNTAGKRQ